MRFCFEREDVTIDASQIRQLFGFPELSTRLHSLCYGTSDPPRCPHGGVAPATAHVAALFWLSFTDGSRRSLADFTPATKYLYQIMRRTLLPRMGYREATTHIHLWLLGALISHSEFDVVDFLIWDRGHGIGWSSCSPTASICALYLLHLHTVDPATPVPGHSRGLTLPFWLLSSSLWGPRACTWSSARHKGRGCDIPSVRDLGHNRSWWWWWFWDTASASASCASTLTWSWGWEFQCCPCWSSCYWPCFGCNTTVSYSAAGSSGSSPAADVWENALHVSDYSGQTGRSAVAAFGRQGWAPGIYDPHSSAYQCLASSCSVCTSSSSSGHCCTSDSGRTHTTFVWSFSLTASAGHPGLLVAGYQLLHCLVVSATSACCYHCCCGGVYDHFSSDSSCSAASVRFSTSSSFYDRSWIRDWLWPPAGICSSTTTTIGCALPPSSSGL
jgi:hypothetical protein